MKIVVDSAIPYIKGVLEPYFDEVVYRGGRDIDCATVGNARAMVVRTRTRCDAALLGGSSVEMIATATIGTDHIDRDYCDSHSIEVISSAGCNARAVAQWVGSALGHMGVGGGVLGVVGVGHVGREVVAMALGRGFTVLQCDPPRAAAQGAQDFVELDYLLAHSDIVTLHVPLLATTRDMADDSFFAAMQPNSVFLNSSRGEVVVESALLSFGGRFAIDVWRSEPMINGELLNRATIATPHVAGYSARGKARATAMCVDALARHFGIRELLGWSPSGDFRLEEPEDYDITIDDTALRASPDKFESLRRIRP
ncbi:MAG: 4-phosphoerythronate dehydrogenase [Mucinivorans sp.]